MESVLRPLQHSIGYMGDGFYRSKDPTNNPITDNKTCVGCERIHCGRWSAGI